MDIQQVPVLCACCGKQIAFITCSVDVPQYVLDAAKSGQMCQECADDQMQPSPSP